MSDTFIFCTSYFADQEAWGRRYVRWLNHHAKVFPATPLVMIDDGSPYTPADPGILVCSDLNRLSFDGRAAIYRFPNRLGRPSLLNYPGWYRSFTFSVEIARRFKFKKIVHVESDAFILTHKAANYINGLSSGWTAFWHPSEAFAETCVQIICEDCFASLNRFRMTPYETQYVGKLMELHLPITHIERSMIGNRYATTPPPGADYAVLAEGVEFTSEFD